MGQLYLLYLIPVIIAGFICLYLIFGSFFTVDTARSP
jgi:hypothetical protein